MYKPMEMENLLTKEFDHFKLSLLSKGQKRIYSAVLKR